MNTVKIRVFEHAVHSLGNFVFLLFFSCYFYCFNCIVSYKTDYVISHRPLCLDTTYRVHLVLSQSQEATMADNIPHGDEQDFVEKHDSYNCFLECATYGSPWSV